MGKLLSGLVLLLFVNASCNKNPKTVAFTNSAAKPIFDSKCKSCHGSGMSAQRSWLYDASDYNGSIKPYISSIYSTVYVQKSMPQGSTLTQAELSSFKAWYDAGYPAN